MGREGARLLKLLENRLPDATGAGLRKAILLAERDGVGLYLVGGGVRDLLLGGEQVDLDLLVEGDALALASDVAAELNARLVSHPRFGTAVVQGEGFRLDLAGARTEQYLRPGALPSVRPALLKDDLGRRDFSINAMALRLVSPRAGEVIDPHGGRDDLARREVRVLHDGSFRDDATRILRALRYAGRLLFRVEGHTEDLLRRDLSYLDAISGARLRHEFERIACEERVEEMLRLANRLGVAAAVHSALRVNEHGLRAAARLPRATLSHRDAVLLCLLIAGASSPEAEGAIDRLALTRRQADAVRGFLNLCRREARLARPSLRASEAVRLLAEQPSVAVEAFALFAGQPLAGDRARRYLGEWRFVRPRLNGLDVEALGVPHGSQVGAVIASLREARLDGRTKDREDEVAMIRRMRLGRRLPTEARHE
jgi:tRNA nucleotidyltransferase (CCA-adding enzyme)